MEHNEHFLESERKMDRLLESRMRGLVWTLVAQAVWVNVLIWIPWYAFRIIGWMYVAAIVNFCSVVGIIYLLVWWLRDKDGFRR